MPEEGGAHARAAQIHSRAMISTRGAHSLRMRGRGTALQPAAQPHRGQGAATHQQLEERRNERKRRQAWLWKTRASRIPLVPPQAVRRRGLWDALAT